MKQKGRVAGGVLIVGVVLFLLVRLQSPSFESGPLPEQEGAFTQDSTQVITPKEAKELSSKVVAPEKPQGTVDPDLRGKNNSNKSSAKKSDRIISEATEYYLSFDYLTQMTPDFKKIQGYFSGEMKILKGSHKGRVDLIELSIDFVETGHQLDGIYSFVITYADGTVYSRMTGNGPNKAVKQDPIDPYVLYLDASPREYLALNVGSFPELSGRFYDASGEYYADVVLHKE